MGYSVSKPTIFILLGYPGAGKTYFARRFAEKLSLIHVQADRTRFELFESPTFNIHEEAVVDRMVALQTEQLLKAGASIVLDGDFSLKKSRRNVYDMAKKSGHRVLVVWCQTDVATSLGRAKKRDHRNADNQFNVNIDEQTFEMIASKLKKPNGEPFIVISGKHDFSVQYRSVMSRLERLKLVEKLSKPQTAPLKDVISAVSPKRRARALNSIPVSEKR